MITDDDFVHSPEHDNSIAVQDNTITQEYLANAMTYYFANFWSSSCYSSYCCDTRCNIW